MLDRLGGFEPLSPPKSDSADGGASLVISSMLAGLKNWEQGQLDRAVECFKAVIAAKLPADDSWASIYQQRAADYLDDHTSLVSPVFSRLPTNKAGCEAAVAELDEVLASLKTHGRARFNVRAWQLDITRHAKLLQGSAPNGQVAKLPDPPAVPNIDTVMQELGGLAGDFRFTEATAYLKSLAADPQGATRDSLLALAESSTAFLADLEDDLAREPVSAELPLRSGGFATRIAVSREGGLAVSTADGATRACEWRDFTPDALINLHRLLVKNPKSELDRLRRHESAIAFEWLAGNRERAISAANVLAQGSPVFKQRWDAIAGGLPK